MFQEFIELFFTMLSFNISIIYVHFPSPQFQWVGIQCLIFKLFDVEISYNRWNHQNFVMKICKTTKELVPKNTSEEGLGKTREEKAKEVQH